MYKLFCLICKYVSILLVWYMLPLIYLNSCTFMDPLVSAALISGGLSTAGGIGSFIFGNSQNRTNAQIARENMQLQRETNELNRQMHAQDLDFSALQAQLARDFTSQQSDLAYQRNTYQSKVLDALSAGLNPSVVAGGSGNPAVVGSSSQASTPSGSPMVSPHNDYTSNAAELFTRNFNAVSQGLSQVIDSSINFTKSQSDIKKSLAEINKLIEDIKETKENAAYLRSLRGMQDRYIKLFDSTFNNQVENSELQNLYVKEQNRYLQSLIEKNNHDMAMDEISAAIGISADSREWQKLSVAVSQFQQQLKLERDRLEQEGELGSRELQIAEDNRVMNGLFMYRNWKLACKKAGFEQKQIEEMMPYQKIGTVVQSLGIAFGAFLGGYGAYRAKKPLNTRVRTKNYRVMDSKSGDIQNWQDVETTHW